MANLLRQLVARPRARHHEANLDLCYVTDNIIATSGPSATYPKKAYRNPLSDLLKFLNQKHPDKWMIWEFRAEGTGYPDSAVDNRIWHFPWPDHHPPPFQLIPRIVASMRDWRRKDADNVVVVHCKAGKGRSGTASCAYLMSEENWGLQECMDRFTERRMRNGWGNGISIPSQQRYLRYVDRWRRNSKVYVERKVRVLDVRVWGLRDGVTFAIEGFTDEGKKIKNLHTFDSKEEMNIERGEIKASGFADAVMELMGGGAAAATTTNPAGPRGGDPQGDVSGSKTAIQENVEEEDVEHHTNKISHPPYPHKKHDKDAVSPSDTDASSTERNATANSTPVNSVSSLTGADVLFTPKNGPIVLETSDVLLDIERRTRGTYTWAVPTSVAHVWFNTWFEGSGPELITQATQVQATAQGPPTGVPAMVQPNPIDTSSIATSGTFMIEWDAMDGLKGSSKKGIRAFDRVAVRWEAVLEGEEVMEEPREGDFVKQSRPANWRGGEDDKSERWSDGDESGEEGIKAGTYA